MTKWSLCAGLRGRGGPHSQFSDYFCFAIGLDKKQKQKKIQFLLNKVRQSEVSPSWTLFNKVMCQGYGVT